MKIKFLPLAFLFAWSFLLCSCFNVNSVLKVNKDGSGTYEMTVVKPGGGSGGAADLIGSLLGGKPAAGKADPIPTRKALEAKALTMGEGVTLASIKEIQEKDGENGYKAVYAFEDINTLSITGAEAIEELADQVKKGAVKGQKPVKFTFTPGDAAKLVMKNPNKVQKGESEGKETSPKGKKEKLQQQGMELMLIAQMFKGTKINFELQVNGKIIQTNALHADGNRITLVNIDFDQATKDEKFMASLKKATEGTVPNVRQLDNVEGIEVDTQEKVEVEFK